MRTYFELTADERKQRATLTAKEARAVSDLVRAVRRLPSTLCADIDDEGFTVRKRITAGSAVPVAKVRRKSLTF